VGTFLIYFPKESHIHVRYEVFTARKAQIVVFWVKKMEAG
jgi:hypothetical protein